MHVNGKKTAVSGLLMAVSVLLIILSGLIEIGRASCRERV